MSRNFCIVASLSLACFFCAPTAEAKVACDSAAAVYTLAQRHIDIIQAQLDNGLANDHPAVRQAERQMQSIARQHCFEAGFEITADTSNRIPNNPSCVINYANLSSFSGAHPHVYWFECAEIRE